MNGLFQDVRYTLRQLRRSPGFTFVAVITLALGIGANTTIFTLIDSIMLRTLPVQEPERLVQLNWSSPGEPDFHGSYNFSGCLGDRGSSLETGCTFSYPVFERMKTQHDAFLRIFAFAPAGLTVNFSGRTSAVQALLVSGDFFTTFGAHPALGRFLAPSDDADNAPPSVVVSYRFWRTVLGGDAHAIGQPIRINKASAIITGVAPPEFPDLDPGNTTDLWLPLAMQPTVAPYFPKRTTASTWLEMIARLKPGVGIAQAEAAASTVFAAETTSGAVLTDILDFAARVVVTPAQAPIVLEELSAV